MSDIDALVLETTAIMESLISKPKMIDKYLRKPPFRYIHDIVVALVQSHQFPSRLTAPDLDYANFTERVRATCLPFQWTMCVTVIFEFVVV
jgi:TRAF3-interacting protein 1